MKIQTPYENQKEEKTREDERTQRNWKLASCHTRWIGYPITLNATLGKKSGALKAWPKL